MGIFAGVTTWGWGRPSSGKQISSNIMKYLMQLPGSLAKVVNPMAGSRLRLQVPPDLECPGHLGSPAIAVATAIVGAQLPRSSDRCASIGPSGGHQTAGKSQQNHGKTCENALYTGISTGISMYFHSHLSFIFILPPAVVIMTCAWTLQHKSTTTTYGSKTL